MDFAGIDIGKSIWICRINDTDSRSPRDLLREGDFLKVDANCDGVLRCLQFLEGVSYVGLEPTGAYSRIWIEKIQGLPGTEIKLVRHDRLAPYRKNLDLPDKNDLADSLALSFYTKEHFQNPFRFVFGRDATTEAVRTKVLRLGSYARLRTGLIARIKSLLLLDFPELANYRGSKQPGGKPPLFWRWIIGESKSDRIALKYQKTIGHGISEDTVCYSRSLCSFYERESVIERELMELLETPKYSRYIAVFDKFGLGLRTSAILLSQIFPIEKYFNENGEPDREWKEHYWRDYSLRRFKKSLGIAPQHYQSGEGKTKLSFGGSGYCRQALLMAVLVRVEVAKNRVNNSKFNELVIYLENMKVKKVPAKKRRFKVAAKMCEMIYFLLVPGVSP